MIKVLFFGDIVGKIGRECFFEILPELKKKHSPDLIILNGENSANGRGITPKIYRSYLNAGIHCITSGNHIFDNKEILSNMEMFHSLIRPLNYPINTPGNSIYKTTINGTNIAIVNLLGQVFMPPTDSPFHTFEKVLTDQLKDSQIIIVDIHAEATSEKKAFGYYFSRKISAVIGTHTHVQTNDAQILDNYTAYITDVGMLGAKNSILGMEKDSIIQRFITNMPERISPADLDTEVIINYIFMEIDSSGKAKKIETFNFIN